MKTELPESLMAAIRSIIDPFDANQSCQFHRIAVFLTGSSREEPAMTRLFTIAVLGLAFAMATCSLAEGSSPTMPPIGMMGGGCAMMNMMGQGTMGQGTMGQGMMRAPAKMTAIVEGRLAYLKSELGITDAQKEAWAGYANAVKVHVTGMENMHLSMMDAMHKGSAIDRMDARIAGMEAMLETMKAVKPPIERLYSALSDEQKKRADQMIGMDCGAM
jgi:hypothetical protein